MDKRVEKKTGYLTMPFTSVRWGVEVLYSVFPSLLVVRVCLTWSCNNDDNGLNNSIKFSTRWLFTCYDSDQLGICSVGFCEGGGKPENSEEKL